MSVTPVIHSVSVSPSVLLPVIECRGMDLIHLFIYYSICDVFNFKGKTVFTSSVLNRYYLKNFVH